ncbi:MAG: ferredoxin [Bacilli bacterium]
MKVKIISDSCIGCGACQALVPNVFSLNDEGIAEVIVDNINSKLDDEVNDAIDSCPTGAILLDN